MRERKLEPRKQRRVVERPLRGGLEVPLAQRARVRDRKPIPVHIKIGGRVARHEQDLDARDGEQREPRRERRQPPHDVRG